MSFKRFIVFKWADRDCPGPFDSVIYSHDDLSIAMDAYNKIDDCYCSCIFDCEERKVIDEREGTSIFV